MSQHIAQKNHKHTFTASSLSCMFPEEESADGLPISQCAAIEGRFTKLYGRRNWGTENDFNVFCESIKKYVKDADTKIADDFQEFQCGVAQVRLDTILQNQSEKKIVLEFIVIRPIAQRRNLFRVILHSILQNLNGKTLIIDKAGPLMQEAIERINHNLLQHYPFQIPSKNYFQKKRWFILPPDYCNDWELKDRFDYSLENGKFLQELWSGENAPKTNLTSIAETELDNQVQNRAFQILRYLIVWLQQDMAKIKKQNDDIYAAVEEIFPYTNDWTKEMQQQSRQEIEKRQRAILTARSLPPQFQKMLTELKAKVPNKTCWEFKYISELIHHYNTKSFNQKIDFKRVFESALEYIKYPA